MRRRPSLAVRILAPLALLAAIGAVWAVLHGEVDKAAKDATSSTAVVATRTTTKKHRHVQHTYRVRSGDVLSVIAARTHVSLARIEALNPNLDANALQTGQVIKLTR